MARSGVDGATLWLAGAVRVLQKEVRVSSGILVERQWDPCKNQEEMAETHTTEKQLKNTHAFDLTDTTSAVKSYGFDEAVPFGSVKYKDTTESEFAECSGQFSVDYGEAWLPAATTESELAESAGVFFVDDGEARPPEATTESELAECWGKFSVEVGDGRPPNSKVHRGSDCGHAGSRVSRGYDRGDQVHSAERIVEQIVDVLTPQFHEDTDRDQLQSHFQRWPCEKVSAAVTKWARGIRI